VTLNPTARRAAAPLAGATLLLLTACGPDDARRDEATGEITASAEADVFSLQVGDCLDLAAAASTTGEVESLPTVPCTDPHDGEVYAETDLTGDTYPADLETQAQEFCYAAFAPFVGLSYEESTIDFTTLSPTSTSWDQGDRGVQCILQTTDGQVTGTLEGAAA
jgi:hypothetical protein